jgi:hypothetical protein
MNTNLYPEYNELVNGIYSRWNIFVLMIHEPKKKKVVTHFQNAWIVKNILKCYFGILQVQFAMS